MKDHIDVIILSQESYRESDVLLKVLTQNSGILTFVAKGLNKMSSKNRVGTLVYSSSDFLFNLKERSDIQNLQSVQVISNRYHIAENLERSSVAAVLIELTILLLKNESDLQIINDTYVFMNTVLNRLNVSDQSSHLLVYAMVYFLDRFGILPHVDACLMCDGSYINSFSLSEGGFICADCQKGIHSPILEASILKEFRAIIKLNEDKLEAFLNYPKIDYSNIKRLFDFFIFHTGYTLNAWDFIDKYTIIK